MTFAQDIQVRDTNLYPVAVIDSVSSDAIYLSTNSTTIGGQHYSPILLNIPSLKESIDIEKRNYKISNISLSISNYEHDGVRFSETVGDKSLVNKSVEIYWISPSVTSLDDAELIYRGWILRYDIDSDKIKLTIEDRSQAKFDKDLPSKLLSIEPEDGVPDQFKNKPIPIVYGFVEKSPLVTEFSPVYAEEVLTGANIVLLADENTMVTPLWNYYYNVLGNQPSYEEETQWTDIFAYDESYVSISRTTGATFDYPELDQYNVGLDGINNRIVLGQQGGALSVDDPLSQNEIIGKELYHFNKLSYELVTGSHETQTGENNPTGSIQNMPYNHLHLANSTMMRANGTWGYTNSDDENVIPKGGSPVWSGTFFIESDWDEPSHARWDGQSATDTYAEGGGHMYGLENWEEGAFAADDVTLATINSNFVIPDDSAKEMSSINLIFHYDTYVGSLAADHEVRTSFKVDFFAFNTYSLQANPISDYVQFNVKNPGMPASGSHVIGPIGNPGYGFSNTSHEPRIASGYGTIPGLEQENLALYHSANSVIFELRTYYLWGYSGGTQGGISGWQFVMPWGWVEHHILLTDLHKMQFYSDIKGRISSTVTLPDNTLSASGAELPKIINHLVANEIYNGSDNPLPNYDYNVAGTEGYGDGSMATGIQNYDNTHYSPLKYAFALNKKINTKKLIEGIASASPYIPRFDNKGNWKFDVIQPKYEYEEILAFKKILSSDVISFSHSRTKVEDVKTKVEFHYKFDYGLDEFIGLKEIGFLDLEDANQIKANYDHDYYGLPYNDDDSTLVVDDDRGKYIRDDTTASFFAKWLLQWHCNQHLKIKLKLPLNYLRLEIGQIVRFDKVLGNTLPYGIDYKTEPEMAYFDSDAIGSLVNASQAFPCFMILKTDKKIDSINIEIVQMHNLADEEYTRGAHHWGCMDEEAWNYDSGANMNTGCLNTEDFMETDWCPFEANPATESYYDPESEADDSTITDWAENYPGDEAFEPGEGGGIFIIQDNGDGYNGADQVIARARAYADTNFSIDSLSEDDITIYNYSACNWVDSTPHIFSLVHVNQLEESTYDNNMLGDPFDGDGHYIELSQEDYNDYMTTGEIKIRLNFVFDTANQPTFFNESTLAYSLSSPLINNIVSSLDNPYSSAMVDDITLVFPTDTNGATHDLAETPIDIGFDYSLNVASNPDYTEIATVSRIIRFAAPTSEILYGDMNGDGEWHVDDIVLLVNCVLTETCEIDINFGTPATVGDMNQDGNFNVLDIVLLANCVLAENCHLLGINS